MCPCCNQPRAYIFDTKKPTPQPSLDRALQQMDDQILQLMGEVKRERSWLHSSRDYADTYGESYEREKVIACLLTCLCLLMVVHPTDVVFSVLFSHLVCLSVGKSQAPCTDFEAAAA